MNHSGVFVNEGGHSPFRCVGCHLQIRPASEMFGLCPPQLFVGVTSGAQTMQIHAVCGLRQTFPPPYITFGHGVRSSITTERPSTCVADAQCLL